MQKSNKIAREHTKPKCYCDECFPKWASPERIKASKWAEKVDEFMNLKEDFKLVFTKKGG